MRLSIMPHTRHSAGCAPPAACASAWGKLFKGLGACQPQSGSHLDGLPAATRVDLHTQAMNRLQAVRPTHVAAQRSVNARCWRVALALQTPVHSEGEASNTRVCGVLQLLTPEGSDKRSPVRKFIAGALTGMTSTICT